MACPFRKWLTVLSLCAAFVAAAMAYFGLGASRGAHDEVELSVGDRNGRAKKIT
jgi:hypothetical protein